MMGPVKLPCMFMILLLMALAAAAVHADKIILKNGDTVSGQILTNTLEAVTIKTEFSTLVIEKSKIRHVLYTKKPPAELINLFLKDGYIIRGKLVGQDETSITVLLSRGERTILKKMIKRVTWDEKLPRADITPALWRSALVPSWGQFHQGRKAKGVVVASVMGILATGTVVAKVKSRQALNDYYRLNTQSALDEANSRRKTYNTLLLTTAGAWVLNILDIIVFPPDYNKKVIAFAPLLEPESRFLAFQMRLRF